jgi:Kef-type K+ transport system membrane component KefB
MEIFAMFGVIVLAFVGCTAVSLAVGWIVDRDEIAVGAWVVSTLLCAAAVTVLVMQNLLE